ncbi:KH domain-containing protein SPIN1 [Platanthera zijinensis]|uniref:KH domain-containing protein SPIN1 n=1 Tax=Platanthera zijinensis TaxID=2320716 RepID=A0AAP0B562_9ASPA
MHQLTRLFEEEISGELDDEPNENEALRSSVDQLPLVNDGDDKSSLLDAKKAADAVADVPRISTKRRRSGWDIKAEDVLLLNDRDDQCKSRKTRWSSGTKTETSMLVNDNTELNKTRKTRWSSDQRNSNLQLFHQKLDKFLKVKTSFPPTINGDHLSKLLEQVDDSISKVVREYEKNKKPKLPPDHNFLFKKKLYLPSKEYPGYNFIGLILGPKGNTLKKMEEDTGATILLRGKSLSRKEEESYLDEDHVLIGADNQFYFDDAVKMVEKLLIPVDDRHNYHKVAQLRELAKIRGTLMEGKTHLTKKDPCDICGNPDHLTSGCPLVATESQTNSNFPTGSGSLFSSNLPSNPRFAAVPPPSNANLPSYPGYVGILPPSLNANLPSYTGFAAVSLPSSNANLSYPGFTASLSSSNANLPDYPKFVAATLCSLNANLPSYPKLPAVSSSSSNSNLPSYSGLTSLPSSSSNANLPSYPGFAAVSPSSKANLPGYPGLASLLPSSSNANPPSYSEFAAIPPPSFNSDLPSYPGFAAIPPSSSIANLPSYPGFAAIPREIPEPNKWPGPPGSILPESGLSFFESRYNSLVQSGSLPFQSSASLGKNADILGEKKLGITVTGTPSSSLNLNSTNYPGFTAITHKIPETNSWPPLSVSVFPDSGTSFPKSGYDSLKYPETMPSQYSAYLSSTGKASISPYQLPSVRAASDELSSFPAYLKSIDTSHPLDQPASSSSLSSQSSYFTKNFSGNQMNPTW